MRSIPMALIFAMAVTAAHSQQRPGTAVAPRLDLSAGFQHIDANAPPGACNCFGLNGAYLSGAYHLTNWVGVAAEVSGSHANNISLLGQNLTLLTFMAGPRITYPGHRITPFAEGLLGGARGSDSYFPSGTTSSTSASGFAYSGGGGVDVSLSNRFAIRAVDVKYLRTSFPNGGDNAQNHLMLGAGIVIKFGIGSRERFHSSPPPPAPRPSEISFSCSTDVTTVEAGTLLSVTGHARTEPDLLSLRYTWNPEGGVIQGTGREVKLDTRDMAAGEYRVTGHAALLSDPSTTASCEAIFRVTAHVDAAPMAVPPADTPAEIAAKDKVFHDNVPDALFDYDSYRIRPDAQQAVDHAAAYLKANPSIQVLVGGYSDERGSIEYNIALSDKRANAARNALVLEGIAPERLKIVSFGKEVQVCAADNEKCWQQNRRAAFALHP